MTSLLSAASQRQGQQERRVLLTDPAQDALEVYLKKRRRILRKRVHKGDERKITGLFFGLRGRQINALDPRNIRRIVREVAIQVGVPWLRPHDLRRAFATHMDEHGASHAVIQRMLGHVQLSTTELYIAASSRERLKATYLKARQHPHGDHKRLRLVPAT